MPAPSPAPTISRTLYDWWARGIARNGFGRTLRAFVAELWGFLRDSTPEQRRRRYGDIEYDWDHHVDTTSATVGWRNRLLGIFHSPYQPTEPALFHEMMAALNIAFENFTFIDLGSGKGRTLLMASDYPFRRIVGVELLPDLNQVSQANLRKYKSAAQKCFQLESYGADARQYAFPTEPVVLYLSNPLPRAGLVQVIENVERSLEEHPRRVSVLYHNPIHEEVLAARPWLKRAAGTHQFSLYENT